MNKSIPKELLEIYEDTLTSDYSQLELDFYFNLRMVIFKLNKNLINQDHREWFENAA